MTTEIDENKISIDYSLFSWKHYEMFMKHIQYVILNPFWCVDNGFQYSYQELVDHDSAKLLDNALSTFDEKYKNIKKIQLHHFYLQQTVIWNKIFKLFNIHHKNYYDKIHELTKQYGQYNEKLEKYIIVTNVEEYKQFALEKEKLDRCLAVTEYDKVNPNLYLIEINAILYKVEENRELYLNKIYNEPATKRWAPFFEEKGGQHFGFREHPLIMYELISNLFDMEKVQNLKINYDLINEHFKNY